MRRTLLLALASLLFAGCPSVETNHPPELVPPSDRMLALGETLSLTLEVSDPDGDSVTLRLAAHPAGAALTGAALSWAPDQVAPGRYAFIVAATDDGAPPLVSYAAFAVDLYDPAPATVNHAPIIELEPDRLIHEGVPVSVTLAASDPDGDTLTWSAPLLPAGAAFDPAAARFTWTPAVSDAGEHYARFVVTDEGRPPLSAQLMLRVVVLAPPQANLPPVFVDVPAPGAIEACAAFEATFQALDPEATEVRYTALQLPPGARVVTEGDAATLEWTPGSDQSGAWQVILLATDQGAPPMSDALIYTLHVAPVPPPAIAPITPVHVIGGQPGEMPVRYSRSACYRLAIDTTLPVVWNDETTTLAWLTPVDGLGIYDVAFRLLPSDGNTVLAQAVGRFVVRYLDTFDAFAAYGTHEVHLDWCCQGPVSYSASEGRLRSSSAFETDVHGFAYRVFDQSQIPLDAVSVSVSACDTVVGPACGSGLVLGLYASAVDPAVYWPSWGNELPPVFSLDIDQPCAGGEAEGIAGFGTSTGTVTLVLMHSDNSNICTVDGQWDLVELTPMAFGGP